MQSLTGEQVFYADAADYGGKVDHILGVNGDDTEFLQSELQVARTTYNASSGLLGWTIGVDSEHHHVDYSCGEADQLLDELPKIRGLLIGCFIGYAEVSLIDPREVTRRLPVLAVAMRTNIWVDEIHHALEVLTATPIPGSEITLLGNPHTTA